jgi:3-isopropylmalate/(R)-2-methylmalate dehydratase small subunit
MSKIIKYGDNVDTDVIIPARYLNTTDKRELARHAMEDLDPHFHDKVESGCRVIVAGRNFGCGSSREHAPIVLKESGISLIIAESFARIFYRNAINIGLAIIECPDASRESRDGDDMTADFDSGVISNESQGGRTYKVAPFPAFIQRIIKAGGLVELAAAGGLR